ncbi:hypothetical protein CGC21_29245 [Leishmania donovani]|uniref:Uncharacterized protein n=1 Tax=Leishmania donovani TaxID=5661 RepID=A0A504XMX8_LEIDO|nr:hypothetical protein CGC21_29245 [Leishmania donovani]
MAAGTAHFAPAFPGAASVFIKDTVQTYAYVMESCCFSKCYHTESGSMARSYFHSSETGANGLGGNESELVYQGKVNIADAKMTEMIISMDNGMMYDDDDVLDPLGYKRGLDQDVISYMDASYRVFPEGADHIMVGLPMRSAQATCAAMQHSELLPAVVAPAPSNL